MFLRELDGVEATDVFAKRLGSMLQPGAVIALEGDLGAGKTTFTKGIAKAMGVKRVVNSPTFTIVKEYMGEHMPLHHMDVYRVGDEEEDLGFDEYFEGVGVTVIEWAHLIESQLPREFLKITIRRVTDTRRKFIFEPIGKGYEEICEELWRNESTSD